MSLTWSERRAKFWIKLMDWLDGYGQLFSPCVLWFSWRVQFVQKRYCGKGHKTIRIGRSPIDSFKHLAQCQTHLQKCSWIAYNSARRLGTYEVLQLRSWCQKIPVEHLFHSQIRSYYCRYARYFFRVYYSCNYAGIIRLIGGRSFETR